MWGLRFLRQQVLMRALVRIRLNLDGGQRSKQIDAQFKILKKLLLCAFIL